MRIARLGVGHSPVRVSQAELNHYHVPSRDAHISGGRNRILSFHPTECDAVRFSGCYTDPTMAK